MSKSESVTRSPRIRANEVQRKVDRIAGAIREEKRISFSGLCVKLDRSPSWLYGYRGLVLVECKDIRFKDGEFYVVEESPVESPVVPGGSS